MPDGTGIHKHELITSRERDGFSNNRQVFCCFVFSVNFRDNSKERAKAPHS